MKRTAGRAFRWSLVVVGLGCAALSFGARALKTAQLKAEIEEATAEAKLLYDGFQAFESQSGAYPNSFLEPAFDLATAEPLRRRGFYGGRIEGRLKDGRFDAYDAPDDRGVNREFWLEMTLAADPTVRLLVVRSDDAPLSGGQWLDGVYLVRHDRLQRVG